MTNYSVLMTVYKKDSPLYFVQAVRSMLEQTVKTNDFVLVCDGEITDDLERAIEDAFQEDQKILNIVRLPQNCGLGEALREGLQYCKNELVARMDDDDISTSKRCERQIEAFEKDDTLSIVGSFMDEFEEDFLNPIRTKKMPVTDDEIRKYSRRRNPFNHSSVMFKKSAIIAVGNYSNMRTNQDVELWIRLLNEGYSGYNIPESLVLFRFEKSTYKRRKDWKNVKLLIAVWKAFRKKHYCSYWDYLVVLWSQIIIFLMPTRLLIWVYDTFR